MKIFVAATLILTIVFVAATIIIQKRKRTIRLKKIGLRQTSLHHVLKEFLPTNGELLRDRPRQSKKAKEESTVRVVTTTDNKAYWVANNVFYVVDVVDGYFDPAQAKPVDTNNLTKQDIQKLLFILDNLKNG